MSTATRTLFQITDDLAEIHAVLVDAEGVLTPEIERRLDAITEELGDKVDAYGFRLRAVAAQASLHKEREAFHAAQRRAYERIEQGLKERLLAVMGRLGVKKLEGQEFKATVRTAPRTEIIDAAQVPASYWNPPAAPSINLAAIKKDLGDGIVVPGARLVDSPYVKVS